MKRPPEPLFLERRIYRRRRLTDAIRVLPVLGTGLVLLPLLGLPDGAGSTLHSTIYLFAVWALLIVLAAVLSTALARAPQDAKARAPSPDRQVAPEETVQREGGG